MWGWASGERKRWGKRGVLPATRCVTAIPAIIPISVVAVSCTAQHSHQNLSRRNVGCAEDNLGGLNDATTTTTIIIVVIVIFIVIIIIIIIIVIITIIIIIIIIIIFIIIIISLSSSPRPARSKRTENPPCPRHLGL